MAPCTTILLPVLKETALIPPLEPVATEVVKEEALPSMSTSLSVPLVPWPREPTEILPVFLKVKSLEPTVVPERSPVKEILPAPAVNTLEFDMVELPVIAIAPEVATPLDSSEKITRPMPPVLAVKLARGKPVLPPSAKPTSSLKVRLPETELTVNDLALVDSSLPKKVILPPLKVVTVVEERRSTKVSETPRALTTAPVPVPPTKEIPVSELML